MSAADAPAVGLLDWSPVLEDYLDSVGLDLHRYLATMTGGWCFGYVAALQRAGCRVVLYAVSRDTRVVRRRVHAPTGATVCLLPAPPAFRAARRALPSVFAPSHWAPPRGALPARLVRAALHRVAPYLSTPPRALARALREDGCRVLLCQEYECERFEVAAAVAHRVGVPVAATFQGGTGSDRGALAARVRTRAIRRAHALVVAPAAEAARVQARHGVPAARVARIFNPLDLAQWPAPTPGERAAARVALALPPDVPVVVWHGRVKRWDKGLDVLLAAWRSLRAALPARDPHLLLLGAGPESAGFAEELRRAHLPAVRHLDRFADERDAVRRVLLAGDVYAFPSRREGMPVAPVEAMACALPVVAADASGVADLLPDGERSGGIVVPREDAAALAAALAALLADDERRARVAVAARARVEQAFSLDTVGRQLVAALGVGT